MTGGNTSTTTNNNNNNQSKSTMLSRLRTAVNKVRFIITTLTATSTSLSWRAVTTIVQSSSAAAARRRQRKLANRPPLAVGLTLICDDEESYYGDENYGEYVRGFSDLSAATTTADDDHDPVDVGGRSGTRSNSWNSRPSSSPGSAQPQVLLRTTSCPSSSKGEDQEDVDTRAELFIENFCKQLRYEKQISLELRYCRVHSAAGSSSSSSVSSNSYSSLHIISPVGR